MNYSFIPDDAQEPRKHDVLYQKWLNAEIDDIETIKRLMLLLKEYEERSDEKYLYYTDCGVYIHTTYNDLIHEVQNHINKIQNSNLGLPTRNEYIPQYIKVLIDEGNLDVDGKTVLSSLKDVILSLKEQKIRISLELLERSFINRKTGKPYTKITILKEMGNQNTVN